MAENFDITWLRKKLQQSALVENADGIDLINWLEERRRTVPFRAELISLPDVRGWKADAVGNFRHKSGQFFGIEGVRVSSAPGVREIAGWDQPILTQTEGGVLALVCRETTENVIEFLLQAKADPGNIGYLQYCPTIQSTWENIKGLQGAKRATFAELLDNSSKAKIIYRSKHNEEGSRFWQKSNENMILYLNDTDQLTIKADTYRWANLSQIKSAMLLDNVIGPYVRTVLSPL